MKYFATLNLKTCISNFIESLQYTNGLSDKEHCLCRNLVLGLWEKDVRHFLMVTDCGISELPSTHEPPRASLIREIHKFLDYHVRACWSLY